MTRQQALFVLGVIGLMRWDDPRRPLLGASAARDAYERCIEAAIKRGLDRRVRRQLIGAARRGKATPFVMALIEQVCTALSTSEIDTELRRLSLYLSP
jgi:hypothetical protein